MEHQKVLKAREKDCWERGRVLVWGTILRGRGTVLVGPRLPVEPCPMERAALPLVLGAGARGMALETGMAY